MTEPKVVPVWTGTEVGRAAQPGPGVRVRLQAERQSALRRAEAFDRLLDQLTPEIEDFLNELEAHGYTMRP